MKINGYYIGYPRRDDFVVERTINFKNSIEMTEEQVKAFNDTGEIRLISTLTGALKR